MEKIAPKYNLFLFDVNTFKLCLDDKPSLNINTFLLVLNLAALHVQYTNVLIFVLQECMCFFPLNYLQQGTLLGYLRHADILSISTNISLMSMIDKCRLTLYFSIS